MNEEKIRICPICGSKATLEKTSMERGNGGGYPGKFTYKISCTRCDYLWPATATDIYCSEEEAIKTAVAEWEKTCDKVEKLLEWRNNNEKNDLGN